LNLTSVVSNAANSDPALHRAGVTLFGSWKRCIQAAGLNYDKVGVADSAKPKYPTAASIIRAIKTRHKTGLALNTLSIAGKAGKADSDASLYRAARAEFGSWRKAIEAAGIDYRTVKLNALGQPLKYPDKAAIIAEIKRRKRKGIPSDYTHITLREETKDLALVKSIRTLFGSLKKAIEAAGIDYDSVMLHKGKALKYPTRKSVIAEIKKRHMQGLPLNAQALSKKGPKKDVTLYQRARTFFDSWEGAIQAAGVNPAKVLIKTRPPSKYTNKKVVLDEIRNRLAKEMPLTSQGVRNPGKHQNYALYTHACAHFGGWKNAVEAAGVDYQKVDARTNRKKRSPC